MKIPFSFLAFVSSFAALFAFPLSPALAVAPLVLTGLVLMLSLDYRQPTRIRLPQPVRHRAPEWFRLAA
ncbi:hypothetical protein [Opitutus terrae]|nr:hypothetical protein [Opitutus terrae]